MPFMIGPSVCNIRKKVISRNICTRKRERPSKTHTSFLFFGFVFGFSLETNAN